MTSKIETQLEESKKHILEFVKTEKKTSIDRVQKFLNEKGLDATLEDSSASIGSQEHKTIIYWISNNHLLIRGLEELIFEGKLIVEKCESWRYNHQVGFPIARKIKSYSDPRWYPVLLSINTDVESGISKLEKEIEEKINAMQNDSEITDKIKYIVSNDHRKRNAHYEYCRENNIPYIVAEGKKYYTVDLDMYQTPFNLTKGGQKAIEYTIRWELLQNPKHMQKKYDWNVNSTICRVYPIEKEGLDEFCKKLFYLSYGYKDFVDEKIKELYYKIAQA